VTHGDAILRLMCDRTPGVLFSIATVEAQVNDVETWYHLQQGVTTGPVSRAEMENLVRAGTVRWETMVWPGYGEWIAAGTSALAPVLAGTPPPPAVPAPSPLARKDWLPKDKKTRTVVLVIIAILGLYFIYNGVQQMRGGMDEIGSAQPSSVILQGCRGVSASAVQCGFQNTGTATQRLCMDVVVTCTDGRHVASTCSDPLRPGETGTKVVDNFHPEVTGSMTCSPNATYENVKTKG
jgi:hypothetical protein